MQEVPTIRVKFHGVTGHHDVNYSFGFMGEDVVIKVH